MTQRLFLKYDRISFRYVNWRDVEHAYDIELESIEFAPYGHEGLRPDVPAVWVLHGHVVTRDGEPRPELDTPPGGKQRRTFVMSKMMDVEVVR